MTTAPLPPSSPLGRAAHAAGLRWVRLARWQHPGATPEQVVYVLQRQYLTAMTVGTAATGLLALRPMRTTGALGLSAGHLGASGALAGVYLSALAHVYGLDAEHTRGLLAHCVTAEHTGVLEQQLGLGRSSWWATATAALPVSQVQFVDRLAARQLHKTAAKRGVVSAAALLPGTIGVSIGASAGRIWARHVIDSAAELLGAPPQEFLAAVPAPLAGGAAAGAE